MSKLRPIHAMIVALTALVFATTGISIAADAGSTHKPAASGAHAHAAAAKRGPRGKTGKRGPAGPRGATGPAGAAGAAGAAGSPGLLALKTVDSPEVTLAAGQSTYDVAPDSFQATCPAGFTVVGSGFNATVGHVSFVKSYGTMVGGFIYNDTGISIKVSVQAICAQLPVGTSTSRSVRGAGATLSPGSARFQADLTAARSARS